jgi:hypothetical protein
LFDFHLKADSLDVKKAYDEIKLFRDMVPAQEKQRVWWVLIIQYRES